MGQNEFLLVLLCCDKLGTFYGGCGIQRRDGKELCPETGGVLPVAPVMMEFVSRGRQVEKPGISSFLAVGRQSRFVYQGELLLEVMP